MTTHKFGGEISFSVLKSQEGQLAISIFPVEGDCSQVFIRLGPQTIRLGYADGLYYDLKPVSDEVLAQLKSVSEVLIGEVGEEAKIAREYFAKIMD